MYLHKTDHKYSDTRRHMTAAKKAAADLVTVPLRPFPTEKCFPAFQNSKSKAQMFPRTTLVMVATPPKRRKEKGTQIQGYHKITLSHALCAFISHLRSVTNATLDNVSGQTFYTQTCLQI